MGVCRKALLAGGHPWAQQGAFWGTGKRSSDDIYDRRAEAGPDGDRGNKIGPGSNVELSAGTRERPSICEEKKKGIYPLKAKLFLINKKIIGKEVDARYKNVRQGPDRK